MNQNYHELGKQSKNNSQKFSSAPILNRLFAWIIDYFISIFILLIIGVPLYTGISASFNLKGIQVVWLFFIFVPIILWGYFIITEYKWGFTLGKKITGLRVISESSTNLNILNAILRTVCKIIPFNSISIIANKENRGWHDKIARTIVIRDYELD